MKFSGDHNQVSDDDAPTDPPLETGDSVIGTAAQLYRASDHTDAALDAIPKTLSLFEPGLFFALTLLFRHATGLWDRKLLYARLTRPLFVRRGEKGAIPSQDMRRMMEQTSVLAQCGQEPGLIGRIARGDDLPSDNHATVHFGIVDLVAKLSVMRWCFAPTDNLRVRLNETHDFVRGRYAFAFQHTPFCLRNDLLNQREHCAELFPQALGRGRRRFAQRFGHRTTLGHRDVGNRQKFRIRLINGFF